MLAKTPLTSEPPRFGLNGVLLFNPVFKRLEAVAFLFKTEKQINNYTNIISFVVEFEIGNITNSNLIWRFGIKILINIIFMFIELIFLKLC